MPSGLPTVDSGMWLRSRHCRCQALSLDPGFCEAAFRLGETLAFLGKLSEAIEIFSRLCAALLRRLPISGSNSAKRRRRWGNTLKHWRPASAPPHASLGNLRYFLGNCDEAVVVDPLSPKAALYFHLSLPLICRDAQH